MNSSIEIIKRPRGRAPKGKEWDSKNGQWIMTQAIKDKDNSCKDNKKKKDIDPWVLVADNVSYFPRSLNQDKEVITLIRKYLANANKNQKNFNTMKFTDPEDMKEMNRLNNLHYELAFKLEEIGVFHSKYCNRETWKLKRLSKLDIVQQCNFMNQTDRT